MATFTYVHTKRVKRNGYVKINHKCINYTQYCLCLFQGKKVLSNTAGVQE